jgi:hypothetical protein
MKCEESVRTLERELNISHLAAIYLYLSLVTQKLYDEQVAADRGTR